MSKTKKYLILFNIFSVVLILILALIIILLLIQRNNTDFKQTNVEVNTSENPNVVDKKEVTEYNSDYLTADLLNDWKIKEYNNELGMAMKVEKVEYSGLTGFEILYKNKIVFSLKGIDGIGLNDACETVFSFSDTDPVYIEMKKDEYADFLNWMGDSSLANFTVKNLSSNYTELSILNINARIIGDQIYWNDDESDEFFNPKCGSGATYMSIDAIEFFSKSQSLPNDKKTSSNSYKLYFDISDLSEDNINELVATLNSLQSK